MKNNMSKTLWGVFFLGFGLIWFGTSLGIIKQSAFSGLLFSFILILFGIRFILRGNYGEEDKDNTIEDNSDQNNSGEYAENEDDYGESTQRGNYYEEPFQADTSNNGSSEYENMKSAESSPGRENYTSIFSSHNIQCTEEFTGAEITAVAGSVELDLRNAVISRDIVIDVNCFMGGIDIFLPSGVEVSVSCVPIMGGVESKINGTSNRKENKATVYIRGTCIMAGIEIR